MIERMMMYATPYQTAVSPQLGVSQAIDPDAPFRLYSIAVFPTGGSFANNGFLKMRFTRPDGSWMQRELIPTPALNPGWTNPGSWNQPPFWLLPSPLRVNLVYPPGSVIQVDIGYTDPALNGSAMNAIVIFIGTNAYREGGVWAPSYPKTFSSNPYFGYNLKVNPADINNSGIARDVPLQIKGDADFVWQCGAMTDAPFNVVPFTFEVEDTPSFGLVTFTPPAGATQNWMGFSMRWIANTNAAVPTFVTNVNNIFTVQLETTNGVDISATIAQAIAALNGNAAFAALVALGMTVTTPDNTKLAPPGGPSSFVVAASQTCGIIHDLGVRVKDVNGKYYSNAQGPSATPNDPLSGMIPAAVLFGFWNGQLPGFPYPEIYLPKNGILLFDFGLYSGTLPNAAQAPLLTFKGQKIYG